MGSVVNLNTPRLDEGEPLTAAELADYNRQRNERAACCNGDCSQGRQCVQMQPAEACPDIGSEMSAGYRPVAGWAVEMAFALTVLAAVGAFSVIRWLAAL